MAQSLEQLNRGGLAIKGAVPPTYGLNSQPKSNVMSGMVPAKTVSNPLTGAGQPSKVMIPGNMSAPQTPTPTGTPVTTGWSSGLGIPSSLGGNQTGTPNTVTPGLLNQHKPTTPVKSITDVSGNKVDFHAPATPNTGANTGANTGNKTDSTTKSTSEQLTTNTAQNNLNNYGTSGNPTNSIDPKTQNLTIAGQAPNVLAAGQMTPQESIANENVAKANAQLKGYQNVQTLSPYAEATMYGDRARTPAEIQALEQAPDLAGRASATNGLLGSLGNIYGSADVAGANAALQGIQTAAGRGLAANTSVLGAVAPQSQFGMLTNPASGQIVGGNGAMASGVMGSALTNAIKMIQNGTSYTDAYNTSGLATFGTLGQTALQNALQGGTNGTFNPTAQNASAGQAVSQGTTAQGQAFTLDTGIKQLATLQPIINSVMQNSGINSTDSPLYNQQIGTYISQLGNPGAYAQFQYAMGEMRKFQSQLLASGAGGIPTDVSNTIDSTDISKLSLKDINTAMETLDILGKNQKSILQGQANASLSGNTSYAGTPSSVSSNVPTATPSSSLGSGVTSPVGQTAAGVGVTIGQDIGKIITDGGNILSFILGKIF